jgi:succinoglycan biosynthesis protein ExoM
MIKISICICTRNRQEGLRNLLKSLDNMDVPTDANIRIIVVENDMKNYSEYIVKTFSTKSKFRTSYYLETRQGLAFVRNRSIKEASETNFCCFVDDDQVVASDWLVELVKCQREFNADGVWGPNLPVFNSMVPSYIDQFHTPNLFDYGTIVTYAATNCLLLRKEYLDKIEGPFDRRLNFTGGEDIYLTYQISNLGGIIRYNPKAIAYEIIPNDRTTIKYVAKRCYRNSNTAYYIQSIKDDNFNKFKVTLRLILRLSLGVLIVIPFWLFGKSSSLKGLKKICDAVGGFAFILGKRNKFYK